jgi:mRNA-degrading endonuclease RelE of RelBE toxin-antitoxin system
LAWVFATESQSFALPQAAMRILTALHRFVESGVGDVKRLKGETEELRLRVGDYRVRFTEESDTLSVNRVLHRREAYR